MSQPINNLQHGPESEYDYSFFFLSPFFQSDPDYDYFVDSVKRDGPFELCHTAFNNFTDCEYKMKCHICNDNLSDNKYGNICTKHIPSYSLWDNDSVDHDADTEDDTDEDDCEYTSPKCHICNDNLSDNKYGNICTKHIPSYDSVDHDADTEYDSCEDDAWEEGLEERKLAIEYGLLDYGQEFYDERYYDYGNGYECDEYEESGY